MEDGEKTQVGRPPEYTPEKGDMVCELAMESEYISKIAEAVGVSKATIFKWANNQALLTSDGRKFIDAFARAREIGWEVMAEDTLAISDDGTNDFYTDAAGVEKVDHEHISRSKLRVDTRKFILSKRVPKIWGDKLDVTGIPASQTHVILPVRERIKRLRRAGADEIAEDRAVPQS